MREDVLQGGFLIGRQVGSEDWSSVGQEQTVMICLADIISFNNIRIMIK